MTGAAIWRNEAPELPLRVRTLLLALVVAAHGLGASVALRARVSLNIVPPSVLRAQWIAGEGSAGAAARPSAQEAPQAAPEAPRTAPEPPRIVPEPPRIEPPRPRPRPRPAERSRPRPVESPPILATESSQPISEGESVTAPPTESAGTENAGAEAAPAPSSSGVPAASSGGGAGRGGGGGGGAGQGSGGGESEYVGPDYRAAYLANPPPDYPPVARRMNEEGKVVLRVHITVDGRADEVRPHQGSGSERLDRAAMDAVWRWRFVPARQGRKNVPAWVLVPIQFKLES